MKQLATGVVVHSLTLTQSIRDSLVCTKLCASPLLSASRLTKILQLLIKAQVGAMLRPDEFVSCIVLLFANARYPEKLLTIELLLKGGLACLPRQ